MPPIKSSILLMSEVSPEMIRQDILIRNRKILSEKAILDGLDIEIFLNRDNAQGEIFIEFEGEAKDLLKYYKCVNTICAEADTTLTQAYHMLKLENTSESCKNFAYRIICLFEKSEMLPKLFEIQYYLKESDELHEAYLEYLEVKNEKEEVCIIPMC